MNQRDIINKYPLLFARYYLPMTETCMCWDLQIGKGWYPIIDDLCSKIQKLIDEDVIKKFEFDEIKQKFGSLRINSYQRCKEVEKLIEQAKYRASTTCEECSKTVYYNYDSDDSKILRTEYSDSCEKYSHDSKMFAEESSGSFNEGHDSKMFTEERSDSFDLSSERYSIESWM